MSRYVIKCVFTQFLEFYKAANSLYIYLIFFAKYPKSHIISENIWGYEYYSNNINNKNNDYIFYYRGVYFTQN